MPSYVRIEWMKGSDRVISSAVEVSQDGNGITIARDYYPGNQSYDQTLFVDWDDFEEGYYVSDGSAINPPE